MDNSKQVPWIEKLFTVLVLFISSGEVLSLIFQDPSNIDDSGNSVFVQVIWVIAYLLILTFLAKGKLISRLKDTKFNLPVIFLALLPLLSILWSTSPDVTIRRGSVILMDSLVSFYIAFRYNWKQLYNILLWVFSICVIVSAIFCLFIPQLSIQTDIGIQAWRGAFIHKNSLGRFMAWGTIFFLLNYFETRKLNGLILAVLAFIQLIASKSNTGLVSLILLITVFLFFLLFERIDGKLLVSISAFMLSITVMISPILITNWENILEYFNRDQTLTGRTDLWQQIWTLIARHEILGYGYGAFWLGWNGPSSYLWQVFLWNPTQAHNGVLGLWLELGILGVLLFVISLIYNFRKLLYQGINSLENKVYMLFLVFIMIENVTESTLYASHSIYWILYIIVSLRIGSVNKTSGLVSRQKSRRSLLR